MLEDIRKYTGLFIVALVLIFVGLIFLGNNMSPGGPGSGPILVKTKYDTFSQDDLIEEGDGYIRLAQRLASNSMQSGSFQGYSDVLQYLGTLGGDTASDDSLKRFLVNRASFERARKDYGIHASKKEIDLYQRDVLFTGNDGVFDAESYKKFQEKGLKGIGTINDLNALTGDLLAFQKFSEILGAGVLADETAATESFLAQSQTLSVTILSRSLADFQKDISPSDEDLKAYWEEHRGRYLSEPKRKLTYFVAQPDFEKALAEQKANAKKDVTDAAADAEKTEEELAAAAETETLTAENRKKAINDLGLLLDEDIWVILQQQVDGGSKIAKLEPLAEEYGFEVKTTELLPVSELPAEIRGSVRGARGRTVEQAAIEANANSENPMDALSEVLGVGEDSWALFRADESVEPAELAFDEAKERAKIDYIEEEAEKALSEAVAKSRDAVAEALVAGTSILDAAEAEGLQATQELNLTANSQIPGEANTRDIFRLAGQTKSGDVSQSELLNPLKDRAIFVHVEDRQFIESDQNKAGLARSTDQLQLLMRNAIVQHWFTAQYDASEVEMVQPKS